jgi:hypothetical protein
MERFVGWSGLLPLLGARWKALLTDTVEIKIRLRHGDRD